MILRYQHNPIQMRWKTNILAYINSQLTELNLPVNGSAGCFASSELPTLSAHQSFWNIPLSGQVT